MSIVNSQLVPQRKSLFHIMQEHLPIAAMLEDNGGELTPEVEQALTLNREDFNTKAESIANVIRDMEAEEKMLSDEIDRLSTRLARKVAARKRLEKRLIDASTLLDIPEVRGKYIDLFFRKTTAVQINDERLIPRKYKQKKTTYSVMKAMIKEAIQAGRKVKGAELKTNKNLTIR